jgi:hypothetical protein
MSRFGLGKRLIDMKHGKRGVKGMKLLRDTRGRKKREVKGMKLLRGARHGARGVEGARLLRETRGAAAAVPLKSLRASFHSFPSTGYWLHFAQHTIFLASASDYQYERQDFCRSGLFDLTGKEESPTWTKCRRATVRARGRMKGGDRTVKSEGRRVKSEARHYFPETIRRTKQQTCSSQRRLNSGTQQSRLRHRPGLDLAGSRPSHTLAGAHGKVRNA